MRSSGVWNGVHSALLRINEELHERKVAAPAWGFVSQSTAFFIVTAVKNSNLT
jgi:hypothetical protein